MRSYLSKSPLLLAALLLGGALACSASTQKAEVAEPTNTTSPQEEKKPGELSVDETAQMIAAGGCQAVDANGEETRNEKGIVPGAILLTSYSTYAAEELPTDKETKLVFYCANERCGASHAAAKRAMEQGYSNVYVMGAGIAGWVDAGKEVSFPSGAPAPAPADAQN